jgi:hypothetical protein
MLWGKVWGMCGEKYSIQEGKYSILWGKVWGISAECVEKRVEEPIEMI